MIDYFLPFRYQAHIYTRGNPRVVQMRYGWREGQVVYMVLGKYNEHVSMI